MESIMPNKAFAEKRYRKSVKQNLYNKSIKSEVHSFGKKVLGAVNANDIEGAKAAFVEYAQRLDKASGKGVIHANKAARKKAAMQKRLNALAGTAQ
jgi:small subunit ribosomal protein S20